MDDFKPTDKESLRQRLVEDAEDTSAVVRDEQTKPGSVDRNIDASIDLERQPVLVNLRGGQVLKGRNGILGGLIFMFFGVMALFQGYVATIASPPLERAGMLAILSLFFLVGLLFFCSGVRSVIMRRKRQSLRPGKATLDAEFQGDKRTASNESGAVARKYLTNFLIGQMVLVPALCLGWMKVFENPKQNFGIDFLVVVATIWYAAAAYFTVKKVRAFMGSRKLTLRLNSVPLILGQQATMTLDTNESAEKQGSTGVQISKIVLRCVVEQTVVSKYANQTDSRTQALSRQAFQLYAETRKFVGNAGMAQKIQLDFQLPDTPEFNTSLLSDDPVYWLLSIEGNHENLPIDTSFLLPVYSKPS